MHISILLAPEIRDFITKNANADVKQLALQKNIPEPRTLILDQIKSKQKAAKKIPNWNNSSIVFPSADVMEQASSAATAHYKASLIQGDSFADLTGGGGVDSWAFAQEFKRGHCIERDENLAALLTHNLPLVTNTPVRVHTASAEEFILSMPPVDLAYIDPQRRNENRRGLYKLEDCSPNILDLLPHLTSKTKQIMIKTSPMLDIDQAIKQLKHVQHVHIVESNGECKELLFILSPDTPETTPIIHTVRLSRNGTPTHHLQSTETNTQIEYSDPLTYLYEPSPALQKTGLWLALVGKYPNLRKIAPDTHLFTSDELINDFPGRIFTVQSLLPPQKKAIPFQKANLTVRNFPETVENLKKKLSLKDGGEEYLFACTLKDEKKTLIHTKKS